MQGVNKFKKQIINLSTDSKLLSVLFSKFLFSNTSDSIKKIRDSCFLNGVVTPEATLIHRIKIATYTINVFSYL